MEIQTLRAEKLGRASAKDERRKYRAKHRRKMLRRFTGDFLAGLARGFGMALGFSLLSGLVLIFLQRLAFENVPVIGGFIAELMRIIKLQM